MEAAEKRLSGRRVVIAGAALVIAGSAGILLAFRAVGSGHFLQASLVAEGRVEVHELARGVAACGAPLPPSAGPVPPDIASLGQAGYRAPSGAWDAPAFACARFAPSGALHFQFRWERETDVKGRAVGVADLDGDGVVDREISVRVGCAGASSHAAAAGPGGCSVESIDERADAGLAAPVR